MNLFSVQKIIAVLDIAIVMIVLFASDPEKEEDKSASVAIAIIMAINIFGLCGGMFL